MRKTTGGRKIIRTAMIEESIDKLLIYIYKEGNDSCQVSELLPKEVNLKLLGKKLKKLELFEVNSFEANEDNYVSLFVYWDLKGHEFVEKYGTYSNYLIEIKKAEAKEANREKWSIRSAIGDYGSLYINVLAILISTIIGVYSCLKEDKIKTLESKIDSLNATLYTKQKLLEPKLNKIEIHRQSPDTLEHTTNQAR